MRNCEDLLFGAELMLRAETFYYMKGEGFYHYCCEAQQSASRQLAIDVWNDFLMLHQRAESIFLKNRIYDFQHQVDILLLSFLYTAVNNIRHAKGLSYWEKRTRIHRILEEKKVREMFKRIRVSKLPICWKQEVITIIYKYIIGLDLVLLRG